MDYIQKNKLLMIIVVVLVILNIVSVSYILFSPPPFPGAHDKQKDPIARFLDEELGFSKEQKMQYQKLREEHFIRSDSLMNVHAKVLRDFFDLLKKDSTNQEEVRLKAAVIGKWEVDRSFETYNHFRAIRALCTPEQRRTFDAMITDVLQQPREPRGGPPDKPRGEPPPGGRR